VQMAANRIHLSPELAVVCVVVTDLTERDRAAAIAEHYALAQREIEARRRAEDALRASEQDFREIFELSVGGLAQADVKTGRFDRVNRKLCELTGYSEEELLHKTFMELTHPEDLAKSFASFGAMIRGENDGYDLEKRYICKDGRSIWVRLTAT